MVQQGSALSFTHTVAVTVLPRVKVQVAALSPTPLVVAVGRLSESTQGVGLTVNATRTRSLSVGADRVSDSRSSDITVSAQ